MSLTYNDVQLYAVVGGYLHEVSVDSIDNVRGIAFITAKHTKPFFRWDTVKGMYDWQASVYVYLGDLRMWDGNRFGPVQTVTFEDGSEIDVHATTLASI